MKEKRNRKAGSGPDIPKPAPQPRGSLGELFDIPRAALSGVMQIELAGNTEAVVDGCTGVLEYNENIIRLAGGKMSVRFGGRNLQIKVLTHDSAIIAGYILSVEFMT